MRVFLAVCIAVLAGFPAYGAPAVQRDVALEAGGSLDYFPPFDANARAPLVVLVAGTFWGLRAGRAPDLGGMVVRPLRSDGAAVAVLRHRPAPQADPRGYAEDVASGLAWLFARADSLGFDPDRVVLAGHGSGGQLAALVGLDPSYLAAEGLETTRLAGVFPMSALYDLEGSPDVPPELVAFATEAYPDAAARRAASPVHHMRGDAPPVLALAAAADMPGLAPAGMAFTEGLRDAGHGNAETFIAPKRDFRSILDFSARGNAAHAHLAAFAGVGDRVAEMQELWEVRRYWRDPERTTAGFRQAGIPVVRQEKTPAFDEWVRTYLALSGSRKGSVARESFEAVDLYAWLDAQGPEVGTGRWLETTNARGAKAFLDLEAARPYRPVIVVGIDDQSNLFRVVELYHTLRRTTWEQPEPDRWLLARALGGFLFFLEEPPSELVPSLFGLFALTPDSFRRTEEDPLAPVRALDPELVELVVSEKACVACHTFHGVGGRTGHLRASDGVVVGGTGRGLETYPPKVWRRYVFDQSAVAAEIGATPVMLPPESQRLLYEAVEVAR